MCHLPLSDQKLKEFQVVTGNDYAVLPVLRQAILQRWNKQEILNTRVYLGLLLIKNGNKSQVQFPI